MPRSARFNTNNRALRWSHVGKAAFAASRTRDAAGSGRFWAWKHGITRALYALAVSNANTLEKVAAAFLVLLLVLLLFAKSAS